jgi:hypothetical protein
MKLLTEYLERAVHFERLAAAETDPKLKEQLEKQANEIVQGPIIRPIARPCRRIRRSPLL